MKKSKIDVENDKSAIALFRYGIIAPLINNTHNFKSKMDFYRDAASKNYILPNGKSAHFHYITIKKWYLNYCRDGIDSLMPVRRSDFCSSRKLPSSCIDKILKIKEDFPHITGKAIYNKLIEDGVIKASNVSLSSIYRFLNNNNLNLHASQERLPFEMENANDCWQADTSHGPMITIDGKKVQTYLIQIIDDASRLIVGYQFFLNDNAINFQHVFKQAVKTYGVPKRLFVDNGTPYRNNQLKLICATLRYNFNSCSSVLARIEIKNWKIF